MNPYALTMTNKPAQLTLSTSSQLHQVLGYLLAMASLKTTNVFEEGVEQKIDLRRVEYTILEMLHANPEMKAHQIAKRLNFTRPSTSAWIDKMEAKGLLKRKADVNDMRATKLLLTRSGITKLNQARHAIQEGEASAMAMLTGAEQAILKELLTKFALS